MLYVVTCEGHLLSNLHFKLCQLKYGVYIAAIWPDFRLTNSMV